LLYFLKLGGSLITDKHTPHTPRLDVLTRLAGEIAGALRQNPGLHLLIGHGSGSFGHVPARKYGTRSGVHSDTDWVGFAEVWKEAHTLNQMVVEALESANLPVIAFPPSSAIITQERQITHWNIAPLWQAMDHHLVPVINGDVIFDSRLGGTILSTEDLFYYLTSIFKPDRILLAGNEDGVWEDFPRRTKLIPSITPSNFPILADRLGGSTAVDVTGGMAHKVSSMLQLVEQNPDLKIQIFSGEVQNNLYRALMDESIGTLIQDKES
jgi:isopentenyl phosphate kinase